MRTLVPLVLGLACTSEPVDEPVTCETVDRTNCVEIAPGDVEALQNTVNALEDDSAIVLGEGTYTFDNALTIRNANQVTLIGQGIDETTLDFGSVTTQVNGVDVIADDILLEGFTVVDAPKDAIRVEDSDGVTFRRVKVTWSAGPATENGAYGLYPVRVSNVLMEDCEAYNASDAGIYVGQCVNAIVRNNIAKGNVAGIEIENTQFADVYGNLAEGNTGGLLIFDLPGNPVVGRDIRVHDNRIINNNEPNFAPGGTVAIIPAGTGAVIMASRNVELDNNTFENNQSLDVAILSGLIVEGDESKWHVPTAEIVGDVDGLDLPSDDEGVFTYRTKGVWVHDNTHSGSGWDIDDLSLEDRELGFLLGIVYGETKVDNILYDAIGESAFDPASAAGNSNDNEVCVGTAPRMTFASLDLENLVDLPALGNVFRPDAPFAPFDCEGVRPTAPEF